MSSRTRRSSGWVAGTVALALLAGVLCVVDSGTPVYSGYFGTDGSIAAGAPARPGESIYFGVILASAHDGDVVRFERLDAVGSFGGAQVEALIAILGTERTWIGVGSGADVRAAGIELASYRPLAGTELTATDGPAALVVRLTAGSHRSGFTSARLVFRVNDSALLAQPVAFSATVCPIPAGAPLPSSCAPG